MFGPYRIAEQRKLRRDSPEPSLVAQSMDGDEDSNQNFDL